MPSTATSSGKDANSTGDDIGKRLDRLEELVHSLIDKVNDIKQQQRACIIVISRIEAAQGTLGSDQEQADAIEEKLQPI
ncbi:hypothetical protein GUJ93_ZPchr0013g36172 [Zizania palustris]|uniref:Uncharacterized protein n=1 Tax=Zizania palustris TaxID=103762 RepID=A0A8J6C326_ZIZPA|nr:hypothetical protein GUJ93_ZPchr0013g36172 [Zizania palustris]